MERIRGAVIAGGGIAGAVTAIALRKAGIGAVVYEAYAGPASRGSALTVAPNGMSALQAIGAGGRVAAAGIATPRMVMETGTGRRLGVMSDPDGLPGSRTFARGELHGALLAAAEDAGVEVHYGKRLVGYDQDANGVTARFADGGTAAGEVLIGADGIRSVTRTLLDPDAPAPRYAGLIGLGGWAEPGDVPSTGGAMHLAFGRRAFFGYLVDRDRACWFANLPAAVAPSDEEIRAVPDEEWLGRLREVYAGDRLPALRLLDRTSGLYAGALHDLPPVPVWHRGRVVLAGDSAHATSPSSGQGASLAMESAVELARCLRDLPVARAFAAYEGLRRQRVERVIAGTARVNSDKAAGPVGRLVRDLMFPIAMKTFYRPERLTGWIHRHRIDWAATV